MRSRRHTTPLEPPAGQDAPLFGEEAAVQAQPVVPLGAVGEEASHGPASREEDFAAGSAPGEPPSAGSHTRLQSAKGGPLTRVPLALLLLSALAGAVIGGAGLYLYQSERRPEAQAAVEQSAPPAAEAQEAAPTEEAAEAPAEAEVAVPEDSAQSAAPAVKTDVRAAPPADKAASERAVSGEAAAPAAREGSPKRGKRGEGDATRPARRTDGRKPRPRRVDTIVYPRERRASSREVDSVRGIFEGRP